MWSEFPLEIFEIENVIYKKPLKQEKATSDITSSQTMDNNSQPINNQNNFQMIDYQKENKDLDKQIDSFLLKDDAFNLNNLSHLLQQTGHVLDYNEDATNDSPFDTD